MPFVRTSGVPLSGRRRLQINIQLQPVKHVPITKRLRTVLCPLIWLEEAFELDDNFIGMLRNQLLLGMTTMDAVKWVLIGLGAVLAGASGFLYSKKIGGQKKRVEDHNDVPISEIMPPPPPAPQDHSEGKDGDDPDEYSKDDNNKNKTDGLLTQHHFIDEQILLPGMFRPPTSRHRNDTFLAHTNISMEKHKNKINISYGDENILKVANMEMKPNVKELISRSTMTMDFSEEIIPAENTKIQHENSGISDEIITIENSSYTSSKHSGNAFQRGKHCFNNIQHENNEETDLSPVNQLSLKANVDRAEETDGLINEINENQFNRNQFVVNCTKRENEETIDEFENEKRIAPVKAMYPSVEGPFERSNDDGSQGNGQMTTGQVNYDIGYAFEEETDESADKITELKPVDKRDKIRTGWRKVLELVRLTRLIRSYRRKEEMINSIDNSFGDRLRDFNKPADMQNEDGNKVRKPLRKQNSETDLYTDRDGSSENDLRPGTSPLPQKCIDRNFENRYQDSRKRMRYPNPLVIQDVLGQDEDMSDGTITVVGAWSGPIVKRRMSRDSLSEPET